MTTKTPHKVSIETAKGSKAIPQDLTHFTATAPDGRVFEVKQLDIVQELDVYAMIPEDQSKPGVHNIYQTAASVRKIDGEPCRFPTNWNQLREILRILGRPGVDAIGARVLELMPQPSPEGGDTDPTDAFRADLKNE